MWRVGKESLGNEGMEGIVSPGGGCRVFNLSVSCAFGMEGIAFFLRDLVAFEIDLVDIRSFGLNCSKIEFIKWFTDGLVDVAMLSFGYE